MFFGFFGLMLFFVFHLPIRHDYAAYTDQWSLIMEGKDPWLLPDGTITGNAYGPLFNLLSVPSALHHDLPRAFFTFIWFAAGAYLYMQLDNDRPKFKSQALFLIFFIFVNPYFFLSTVYYGQFDILVAALCLASVVMRLKGKDKFSGFFLALAFLMKIYPIVILPALVLEGWKVRRKLFVSFLVVVISGLGVSYLIWGNSTFEPFSFASGRESTAFSIFRWLRGVYSPVAGMHNYDRLSLPLMAISFCVILIIQIYRKLDPLLASILFLLVTLTFFKVGHSQFYTPLFFLMSFWFITEPRLNGRRIMFKLIALMPLLYISLIVFIYNATDDFAGGWAKMVDIIGLPMFVFSAFSIIALLKFALFPGSQKLPDERAGEPERG